MCVRLCRVSSSVCFIFHYMEFTCCAGRIDLCIIAAGLTGLIVCHVRRVHVCLFVCVCVWGVCVCACVCVCVSSVSCVVECVFSLLARNSHVAQD